MSERTVWLASFPRCGVTMVRLLLEHFYECVTLEVIGARDRGTALPGKGRPFVASVRQYEPVAGSILFQKTHHTEAIDDDTRALVIVRNPLDSLVSYAHYLREVDGETFALEHLTRNLCTSTRWIDFYTHWNRVTGREHCGLIRYEDIVADPNLLLDEVDRMDIGAVRRANVGAPWTFQELHTLWPQMFRKGMVGENRKELSPQLHATVIEKNFLMMERFGYI